MVLNDGLLNRREREREKRGGIEDGGCVCDGKWNVGSKEGFGQGRDPSGIAGDQMTSP